MKGIILTLTLLISTCAFAWVNWEITNVETYVGLDPQSVEDVLTKFPEVLDGTEFEVKDIEYAHVSETTFEYSGETTCEEGDERLIHNQLTYMACPIGKPTECVFKMGTLFGTSDPCL
jgi:hypothetical protein